MNAVLGYLLVEGPHDLAVVERILHVSHGFSLLRKRSALEALIPNSAWLHLLDHDRNNAGRANGSADDLVARRHVPYYLADGAGRVLVIDAATGDSGLGARLQIIRLVTDWAEVTGWGVVLDADREVPVVKLRRLAQSIPGLPASPGVTGILPGPPRVGVHLLPDNLRPGTLEEPLLAAAAISYPKTLAKAQAYVAQVSADPDAWTKHEWVGISKPAGTAKAVIAAITAITDPGMTSQVGLSQRAWVTPDTIANTDLKHLDSFLTALFF